MKYRSKLLAVCFLLSSIGASGAGAKKVETWLDASVKAKAELQAELKKSGMPIVSQWMKRKQNAETFAIEFKLHDWKRAIQQAQSVGLCFDYLYICLPKPKTNSSASKISDTCISNGVGLIFYDTELNEFFIEVEASKTADVWEKERCRIVNYLEAKRDEATTSKNS